MILKEADDALEELATAKADPIGVPRIAAPNDYGTSMIAPLAAVFSRRYPTCCEISTVLRHRRSVAPGVGARQFAILSYEIRYG
jgi:DNA-binding transcriptional LysR family regulator